MYLAFEKRNIRAQTLLISKSLKTLDHLDHPVLVGWFHRFGTFSGWLGTGFSNGKCHFSIKRSFIPLSKSSHLS